MADRSKITDALMRMFTPETAGQRNIYGINAAPDPRELQRAYEAERLKGQLDSQSFKQGEAMPPDPRMQGWPPQQPAPYENLDPSTRDLLRRRGY